ncbi:MAG TPA: hypothetical protein DCY79_26225 [Planctomycetaceae bacterium]|nr:hypothetical protein [Blastopirellula sp.]HAY83319.1 hypothetical protein [Planctomycetaceae bacterium]
MWIRTFATCLSFEFAIASDCIVTATEQSPNQRRTIRAQVVSLLALTARILSWTKNHVVWASENVPQFKGVLPAGSISGAARCKKKTCLFVPRAARNVVSRCKDVI